MPVTVIDRGYAKWAAEQHDTEIRQTVGVQGAKASTMHPETRRTVGEIAALNEMGYAPDNLPSRPFMRRAFDLNEGELIRQIGVEAKTSPSVPALAAVIGERFRKMIHESLDSADSWATPNSLMTVKLKGRNDPLFWRGMLRTSITSERK